MTIAILHGGDLPYFADILIILAIGVPLTLVLIFILFVRWAESRMRSREEVEKLVQETKEIK
jgi:uncharacterized paraquat-inducible protein A